MSESDFEIKQKAKVLEVYEVEVDQLLDNLEQAKRMMDLWISRLRMVKRYRGKA